MKKMIGASVVTSVALVVFVVTLVQAAFIPSSLNPFEAGETYLPVGQSSAQSEVGRVHDVPWTANVQFDFRDEPARLQIPAISVDADVQRVGVTLSGKMANPSNFVDVGWYSDGVVPGEPGSAVMAGHVDNGLALPAVFSRLHDLKPGDEIIVTSESGISTKFIVADSMSYGYKSVPTESVFSVNGEPVLRLITCGGRWLSQDKTYDERLVVTAVLAD